MAAAYQIRTGKYQGRETQDQEEVQDTLEAYAREGARRMLAAALEIEVTEFLGRGRYERGKPFRGYRNGYHPARELTVGFGAVEVRAPRVAGVPAEVAPDGFQSQMVQHASGGGLAGNPAALCPAVLGRAGDGRLRAGVA